MSVRSYVADDDLDGLPVAEVDHDLRDEPPPGGRSGSLTDALPVDDAIAERLAETFKALADPTRVRILSLLTDRERCVHEIADRLDVSQSAISHQLRTLREMRLVRFRKEGRHVYYMLDDDHIRSLFTCGLDHVRHD